MDSKRQIIISAYEALAKVASHFYRLDDGADDADDFLETMMVTESLIDCGGFNHRDLVARFRRGRRTEFGGKVIWTGNRDKQTQMAKLRASGDPFYLAEDGITNGAAMRMLGVALYFPNFSEMVYAANAVARITHASSASRMAAVAVALRMRHMFMWSLGLEGFAPPPTKKNLLLNNWTVYGTALQKAADILGLTDSPFMKAFQREMSAVPPAGLDNLAWRTGFMHVASSSPLAAIAATFLGGPGHPPVSGPALPNSPHQIAGVEQEYCDAAVVQVNWNFFTAEEREQENRAFAPRHDADTFYSMLYPMLALGGRPLDCTNNDVFERFSDIADAMMRRWDPCR